MSAPRTLSEVYGFRLPLTLEPDFEAALSTFGCEQRSAAIRALIESPEVWTVISRRAAAARLAEALRQIAPEAPAEPSPTESETRELLPA